MRLSNDDFKKITDILNRETGMQFEDKKNYFISNRIFERMGRLGVNTFNDYYRALLNEGDRNEVTQLIESVTINETYFFRDFPQLQGFAEQVLPSLLEHKARNNDRDLKIWSAGCSSGEEPFTLSIILQEVIPEISNWNITIHATDIDTKMLERARCGVYNERSMQDTPLSYRGKYFTQKGKDWEVLENVRNLVKFSRVNLIDRVAMRQFREFDIIFCRNVLIYFDDDSRRRVVSSLYDSLNVGGFLFLGHSESISRITASFQLEKIGGFLCHKKAG